MTEIPIERTVLDVIRECPDNQGKDLAVVDLAQRAILASGLVIPSLNGITEIVTAHQAPVRITRKSWVEPEWYRQTERLIDTGFADARKLSPEAYRLSIPKFIRPPKAWEGVFNKPLILDGGIGTKKRHQLMGVKEFIDGDQITDEDELNEPGLPKVRTIYVAESSELVIGTFQKALDQAPKNGVAVSMLAVDMFYFQYPGLFNSEDGSWRDAGKSRYGADNVPYLDVWYAGSKVNAHGADGPDSYWRLLFRGNKIGT